MAAMTKLRRKTLISATAENIFWEEFHRSFKLLIPAADLIRRRRFRLRAHRTTPASSVAV